MHIGGDRGRPGRTRPCRHLARQRQVRCAWRRRTPECRCWSL